MSGGAGLFQVCPRKAWPWSTEWSLGTPVSRELDLGPSLILGDVSRVSHGRRPARTKCPQSVCLPSLRPDKAWVAQQNVHSLGNQGAFWDTKPLKGPSSAKPAVSAGRGLACPPLPLGASVPGRRPCEQCPTLFLAREGVWLIQPHFTLAGDPVLPGSPSLTGTLGLRGRPDTLCLAPSQLPDRPQLRGQESGLK